MVLKITLSFLLVVLVGVVVIQNNVVQQQRALVQQMMTNPACQTPAVTVPKQAEATDDEESPVIDWRRVGYFI